MTTDWLPPEALGEGALVVRPKSSTGPLPILYLLHGQGDMPEEWWSGKGDLERILAQEDVGPMLIVLPYGGAVGQPEAEPPLGEFSERFVAVQEALRGLALDQAPDFSRQGLLGISMGAKQALAVVLRGESEGSISALGLLSAKLQGPHLDEVRRFGGRWPHPIAEELDVYLHYCGQASDGRSGLGDAVFYPNNVIACRELGGELTTRKRGRHVWGYWNPLVADFIRTVSAVWSGASPSSRVGPNGGTARGTTPGSGRVDPWRRRRVIAASLTAPLVGILTVLGLVTVFYVPFTSIAMPRLAEGTARAAFLLLLFGSPGAYVLEGLVGLPAYRALVSRGRLTMRAVVSVAALTGSFAFAVPWHALLGALTPGWIAASLGIGAVGGACAGAWFWLVAFSGEGGRRWLGSR